MQTASLGHTVNVSLDATKNCSLRTEINAAPTSSPSGSRDHCTARSVEPGSLRGDSAPTYRTTSGGSDLPESEAETSAVRGGPVSNRSISCLGANARLSSDPHP